MYSNNFKKRILNNKILFYYLKLKLFKRRKRFKVRTTKILDYTVEYTDQLSLYFEYKDIFRNNIYRFNSPEKAPLIIDAGSCIGLSILYFKLIRPHARIIGFEPDSEIFQILENNTIKNELTDIELVNAALSSNEGEHEFFPDGTDGGSLVFGNDRQPAKVRSVKLSHYINEQVDFLKMNIEGSELDVLTEIKDRLHYINELVIEYHSFNNYNQELHRILDILNQKGFMYLINDFDSETNPAVRTPFNIEKNTRYFLLIYAKRKQDNVV